MCGDRGEVFTKGGFTLKIIIETIPHSEQKFHDGPKAGQPYDTVGNWWWEDDGDTLHMQVSDMGDWRKEMCIGYHEMLEALECKQKGITGDQVSAFDETWKEHDGIDEAGDDEAAPYYWQHQHAMVAEQHLANCLELPWHEYETAVFALSQDSEDDEEE